MQIMTCHLTFNFIFDHVLIQIGLAFVLRWKSYTLDQTQAALTLNIASDFQWGSSLHNLLHPVNIVAPKTSFHILGFRADC